MQTSQSTARRTPFHDVMAELGAEFTELFGSLWPDHFGDIDGEYRAQRDGVGVMDASPINKWEFRGRDAVEAAQRVHTNNIAGAAIGQVRYGAFCDSSTVQGCPAPGPTRKAHRQARVLLTRSENP